MSQVERQPFWRSLHKNLMSPRRACRLAHRDLTDLSCRLMVLARQRGVTLTDDDVATFLSEHTSPLDRYQTILERVLEVFSKGPP